MYALRRLLIAIVLFCLLTFGGFSIAIGVTPAFAEDTEKVVAGLGIFASLIFAFGFLIAPLFSKRKNSRNERPWRVVWVVLGAVLILAISSFLLLLVDSMLKPTLFGPNPILSPVQFQVLNVAWMFLAVIIAATHLRHPWPPSLR